MTAKPDDQRSFRVRTGLHERIVEAATPAAAIRRFRQLLHRELPRLWDLIEQIPEDRISIHEIAPGDVPPQPEAA